MNSGPENKNILEIAWSWVLRQHEQGPLNEAAEEELALWLAADDAHRKAFEKASELWLAAGLLPPAHDPDHPAGTDPADD